MTERGPELDFPNLSFLIHVSRSCRYAGDEPKSQFLIHVSRSCTDTQGDESKSRFEVLAEQRDYKRRRQSYRAKNVHITKRSAVEVWVIHLLPLPPGVSTVVPYTPKCHDKP